MIAIPNMDKPKDCWDCFNYNCEHWGTHGYDFAETDCPLIEIDLVRCGECLNNRINVDGVAESWCYHFGYEVEPTDFCSYGERRTDPKDCKGCKLTNECDHHICLKVVRERRTDE